jgi:UDP-GlcNAc:undecaprenyl-phosphate/decaprenyl-phosphate GlcNAc-1-phosphate transferase
MDALLRKFFGQLLVLAAVPFFIALLATPVVRADFLRFQIVDAPDGRRKLHKTPVPRVGGIPIAFAYVVALLILPAIDSRAPWQHDRQLVGGLIAASAVVFLTGLADDLFSLKPWQKLAGQLVAAGIVCASGVRISALGGSSVADWVGVPLTLIWLALCTNAFNLIDGLDGLASGMGLFATVTMFVAALLNGSDTLALATVPLAGGLLGFLRYNFNPASVFLGDSGSLLVGFLLGSYAVVWSQKSATLLGLAAPAMALAVPLLDVCLSVARRWLRGQPIFSGDRSHIHHKLLDRGLTHRGVVLLLYGVAAVCAALSLIQSLAPDRIAVLVVIVFCCGIWTGVDRLGYLEFHGARRALATSSLRRSIRGEMVIEAVERRIQGAVSVDACWEAVRDASRQLGFSQIEAQLDGRSFRDERQGGASGYCWLLRVPLGEVSYVQVGRRLASGPEPASLAPFVDLVRTTLLPRLGTVGALDRASRPTDAVALARLAETIQHENRALQDTVRL